MICKELTGLLTPENIPVTGDVSYFGGFVNKRGCEGDLNKLQGGFCIWHFASTTTWKPSMRTAT